MMVSFITNFFSALNIDSKHAFLVISGES